MYFTDHDFTERTQIMVWMTSINYFSTLADSSNSSRNHLNPYHKSSSNWHDWQSVLLLVWAIYFLSFVLLSPLACLIIRLYCGDTVVKNMVTEYRRLRRGLLTRSWHVYKRCALLVLFLLRRISSFNPIRINNIWRSYYVVTWFCHESCSILLIEWRLSWLSGYQHLSTISPQLCLKYRQQRPLLI